MTTESGERIYSNEYFDLVLNLFSSASEISGIPNATIRTFRTFAVGYVPMLEITNNTLSQLGYSLIPNVSGIISQAYLEASGITKIRNIPNFNLRGKGVLIGIMDTGIDYTNPIFINADNTTKIAVLWDQTISGENYTSNTYYGTEYNREQINKALQNQNPYEIVPSRDEVGHGTIIAGIAAGNEVPEHDFSGVAPDSELVIVKLKPAKKIIKDFWRVPENAVCYQQNDIMSAIDFIEETANKLGRPMSICYALGSSLSSHDSKSKIGYNFSGFSEILNFTITIASGNEGNARRHFYGEIDPSIGYIKVELNVAENEGNFSMELWGTSPGLFTVAISTPTGEYIPRSNPTRNESYEISFIFEKTKIIIDYQLAEALTGDQLILFRFTDPTPGIWTFIVYSKGKLKQSFHIWLPMNGFISNDTYFIKSDPYTTLLSPASATEPIAVTAYNIENESLYINASKGYTRTNNIQPTVAAPGVNIITPTLEHGFELASGTSLAAAHTAGVAAMLLEWGIVLGNVPSMNTIDVKFLMIRGARRNIDLEYPNREWGYGILDAYNIFDSLRQSI